MAKNDIQKITQNFQGFMRSDLVTSKLQAVLGEKTNTFTTSIIQIVNSNELLKKAEPQTILNAALLATTLELPLNNSLGFAYIVPFNNKQPDNTYRVEAQFQPGYKGFQQLAIRSGQYKELEAKEVYEGQIVEDDSFRGYHFNWKGKTSDTIIGYAAFFELHSGFSTTLYMSIAEIEAHAKKYSQTYKKGFGVWKDDFHKMAKKTVLKLLLNSGKAPLSVEMQKAIKADQAVIKDYDTETFDVDYVDGTENAIQEKSIEEKKEELRNKTNQKPEML